MPLKFSIALNWD